MVTGVGNSGSACCAAIRCGINNFTETRFSDGAGNWIVGSEVQLSQPWCGVEKLGRMLAKVICDAFDSDPTLPPDTPIVICTSERDRPGRLPNLHHQLVEVADRWVPADLQETSWIIAEGRVSGVLAMVEAAKLIYERGHRSVVIADCDSYLRGATLSAFIRKRRILCPRNSNGFVPGEAASAMVVTRPQSTERRQLILKGIGFGVEMAHVESDEPLRADGLTTAIRGALLDSQTEMATVDFRIADLSGEQYSFKEAALALARIAREEKETFDIWHPSDCVGEIGAAAVGVAANIAAAGTAKGYAPGNQILCHFGNDDGRRAAMVLAYE
jgi:3-oxoacyl-[acyl-carrier-protein] synthase-1